MLYKFKSLIPLIIFYTYFTDFCPIPSQTLISSRSIPIGVVRILHFIRFGVIIHFKHLRFNFSVYFITFFIKLA